MKFKIIIDKNADEEIIAIVHAPSKLTEDIDNLVRIFSGSGFIIGYKEDEIRKLTFNDIECITVIDRKVVAIDRKGEKYRISERLRDLENVLPSNFIRINKSTIANEQRIHHFKAIFSGGVDAVFQCGYREYVSRRCFSEIKRRYEEK